MKETKLPLAPKFEARDIVNAASITAIVVSGLWLIASFYFNRPTVSNDELLGIIKDLAAKQGYIVSKRLEFVTPGGWEVWQGHMVSPSSSFSNCMSLGADGIPRPC